MRIRALMRFRDLAATAEAGRDVFREEGEVWEADEARLESLSSSKWGPLAEAAPARKGKPTKAELLAEAGALGIEVPAKATNPQIARMIEEAR